MTRAVFTLVVFSFSLLINTVPARSEASQPEIVGPVASVRSCSEILLGYHGKILAIRIAGIDCPDTRQPFGLEAKDFASTLLRKQTIRVKPTGHDRRRRIWGEVFLSDGRSLSVEMVKAGWAQASATAVNERLYELEQDAKRAKLGQWSEKTPLAVQNGMTGRLPKKHSKISPP